MGMEQRQYTIRFLAPAFVGDAHQNGAWRTPPFKAELRHWWRMAMAARGCDVGDIRPAEGRLFGDAAGRSRHRSAIRIRLRGQKAWQAGSLKEWAPPGGSRQIRHGENAVPADLYLGYGPIEHKKGVGPSLRPERAIDAGESAELHLAWPTDIAGADALEETLALMGVFGTVGGRSRNGWGSYLLEPQPEIALSRYACDWRDGISSPWPRGIGSDEQGLLLWRTRPHKQWEVVIHELGTLRKSLCTEAGPLRPLISYPVTRKEQSGWKGSDRVPNTLRFKVIRNGEGHLQGQVTHFPCRPSDDLWERLDTVTQRRFPEVWAAAHELLDEEVERVSK